MKTVLIVEDEKMIRQGIKAMILRSGVPVDTVIECSNGEMALDVLMTQMVDVMFTDIRMPKMDGIELVERMHECPHVPLTVAISGYDDFSYAVAMMRNGVSEYILKPVERAKIKEVLERLEGIIEKREKNNEVMQEIGQQQLRQIISGNCTEADIENIESQYSNTYISSEYRICCAPVNKMGVHNDERCIYIDNVDDMDVYIIREKNLEQLLNNDLKNNYPGISLTHTGMKELRAAYEEAQLARKTAFCQNINPFYYGTEEIKVPEKLAKDAKAQLEEAEIIKKVQIIGTDRTEDLVKNWKSFFFDVEKKRIDEDEFMRFITFFFSEVQNLYKNILTDEEVLSEITVPWNYDCLDSYKDALIDFVLSLHRTINDQYEINKNQQKIQQAIKYIDENYTSDLNMAVVSNNFSMNYSLFSSAFKQQTGTNFVNYLKELRMKEARRLLEETDMRIIEISQKVGYDNEKHFMKSFKQTLGVSPSEYRKNMKREL